MITELIENIKQAVLVADQRTAINKLNELTEEAEKLERKAEILEHGTFQEVEEPQGLLVNGNIYIFGDSIAREILEI